MPAAIEAAIWVGGIVAAALGIGESVKLAGQGAEDIADSAVKIAFAGATVYLLFLAAKGARS